MSENLDLLLSFLDEQKSIFNKERLSLTEIFDTIIQEYRSAVIQVGSGTAFIITLIFAILSLEWINDVVGQIIIVITIIIATIWIVLLEYFRNQFLQNKLVVNGGYDNSLWTISELKRNMFNQKFIFNNSIDPKIHYPFLFCSMCSERIKMIIGMEELLKIKILRLKKDDFLNFYVEYEDIIKQGKIIMKEFDEKFKKDKTLENFSSIIEPLRNYQIKSNSA